MYPHINVHIHVQHEIRNEKIYLCILRKQSSCEHAYSISLNSNIKNIVQESFTKKFLTQYSNIICMILVK